MMMVMTGMYAINCVIITTQEFLIWFSIAPVHSADIWYVRASGS